MSVQGVRQPPAKWWPAEWVEQAKNAGMDTPPVFWANDPEGFGSAYRLVAYNAPDTTTTERELAAHTPGDDAVAVARAILRARRQRPDLVIEEMLRAVWESLTRDQRMDTAEILAAIVEMQGRNGAHDAVVRRLRDATSPGAARRRHGLSSGAAAVLEPQTRGRHGWTPGLFDEHLEQAYQEAWAEAGREPTGGAIAAHFRLIDGTVGTDEEYLRRLRRWRRSEKRQRAE